MAAIPDQPVHIGTEKQLFIDDYVIAELSGVRKELNQPIKHPANPILTPQEPWEQGYVQLYGNVLFDQEQDQFRMWYSARFGPTPGAGSLNTVCHATSSDGINWQRTAVNQFEHVGITLTNAVLKGGYVGPTVFHTPEDPDPGHRYRMFVFMSPSLLGAPERQTPFRNGYGVLFSPDGLHWTEYEHNPVIQGGDIATCSYDPLAPEYKYVAFPKVHRTDDGIPRRCVGCSTSQDFLSWGASDIIVSADKEDDALVGERIGRFRNILSYDDPSYYCADMYGMTGFCYEGLRLGLIWFFDKTAQRPEEHGGNEEGVMNIQLAYSRGANPYGYWHRAADRGDFLSCGDEGSYDAGMVIAAHTVLEVGDELWFYYTGFDRGHGWERDRDMPRPLSKLADRGASINLATLRRDGFVSLDALWPEGTATTRLLVAEGQRLELNADAENGQILVELLDEQGQPIPGFGKDECVAVTQDSPRIAVLWKQRQDLTALEGKPFRIVFHIRTAKLYSFTVL